MSNATAELMSYLNRIAEKSISGEISWTQPNPSTFQWIETNLDNHFQVTIQKAVSPRIRSFESLTNPMHSREDPVYLFQVNDKQSRQAILSLSSKERPEVYEALAKIFYGAEKGMDVRASKVLKRLLKE